MAALGKLRCVAIRLYNFGLIRYIKILKSSLCVAYHQTFVFNTVTTEKNSIDKEGQNWK